jgi:hypothetical protein
VTQASKSSEGRRDVALTTLIDLLVQVVFVFTLLLIAAGAIDGTPEERGFITPETWKTLVSIFDVDPKKQHDEQAREMEAKYRKAQTDADELRKTVRNLDARVVQLERKAGAPGYPPCRASDGRELSVASAQIDSGGRIAVAPLPSAQDFESDGLGFARPGQFLSRQEFQRLHAKWSEHGMSREPKCKFLATVTYDPQASAGDYQPAIAALATIFRVQKISRRGSNQ